jgi:hypothetical protein
VSPADATIAEGAKLRSLGINTIPILNAIGHCPVPHSTYRDEGMPSDVFEAIVREKHAHGIQVSCGVGWGLAVVDVDGDLGAAWLGCHSVYHPMPPTVAGRTPRDGWQFWYAIPPDVDSLPSCDLWKGPGDHQGVELLADRKLARCYPSYKTIDGERRPYAWEPGRGPGECPLAYLPRWAIDMARRHARPSAPPVARGYQVTTPRAGLSGDNPRPGPSWREVRDAVSDKLSLAERWGLRIVGHTPNAAGWITCRSIFREDRHPSARIHSTTGAYWEAGLGGVMNFFGLAMELGAFPDFPSAVRALEASAGLRRAS